MTESSQVPINRWKRRLAVVFGISAGVGLLAFVVYGLLGEWGSLTTDDPSMSVRRENGLILSGTTILASMVVATMSGVGLLALEINLRRRRPP